MKVNKRSIDSYRKAVDEQAELAKAYVARALDVWFAENPDATTADGREFAIDLLKAALPNFTENAETLAADFFDEMMEAQGIDAQSKLYDPIDYDTVEEKVRYFAGKLNNDDEEAFKKEVVDATRYFVKRSAYENMVNNCRDNNVRYARVPSGFETCAFCFMLASRGFVYHSEAKAKGEHGYHDNCSCTVVPGSKKDGRSRVKIEGYDPETMYRNWSACADAIGGREQIRKEWLALSDEERAEWIERHGSPSKAFARFEQDRIMQEVRTRDWHWLYTGELPKQDYTQVSRDSFGSFKTEPDRTKKPNPADYAVEKFDFSQTNKSGEWKDLFAHDVLRWNGFGYGARTRKFLDQNGKQIQGASSPDLAFQRSIWGSGYLWEVKTPEDGDVKPQAGNELNFISNAFGDAKRRNFNNPFDPETNAPVEDWDGRLRVVLNTLYRSISNEDSEVISKIEHEMGFHGIHEVIWINDRGELRHFKR